MNPTGTPQANATELVTITNAKTGAVKRVKRSDLPTYGLPADYQSPADAFAKGIQTGNITIDQVPAGNRAGVQTILSDSGYQPKDTKKKEDAYGATMNFINNLEGHYQKGGGGSYGDSPLARVFGGGETVKGMLGMNNEAKLYNDEKAGFIASLKNLTGDTGVMTEQDAQRLAGLLPGMSSTTGEATGHMNDIRSQLAAKYGGQQSQTTVNPKIKNLMQVLLPATSDYAQNVMEQRKNVKTPQEASALGNAYAQNAQPLQFLYNLGTGQKQAQEAVAPTAELATAIQAPGLVKGGLSFLKNIPGAFSTKGAIAARDAAAQGVKLNTQPIIDAGEKYVTSVNPAAKKSWDVLKPALTKTTNADDLLKIISDWGDKAYTNSGDVRAIAEGQLKNNLYQAGRNLMRQETPEVAKYTTEISKKMGTKKLLSNAGSLAGKAAVTGGTFALMNYLLGQRQSSGQ
jgi:hypothetical protein